MIKNLFKRTFNIREGEIQIALLMQLYIFLIITVLLLVKPTVTALFLHNLGAENLPYGYLLVAVVAVITSIFYNRLIKKFSIKIIAITTIILFSICFFLLSYVIYYDILDGWVLYFYYLSLSLFGVMVTSQFWVIANIVFDIREAKRLFGFIGAGAIAGGIFGGYLTTFLANFFGNGMVILVASIMLLLCLPIIIWIWRIRVDQLNKFIKVERKSEKKDLSSSSFQLVLKSKHLLNLSAIVGVSVLVAKLIDYQFSDFSHRVYPNPDELASFFGFWFSSFNIIALLIQLFLTNRLLSWFGVSTNMLLLPLGLAIGSFLFLVFPELWVLVLIKGVDGSFKQSVNKAAYELSILPIPYETKKQTKPFIDVVVDSVATGLAGFLLLFVIKKLDVDTNYITLIILFSLFVWFLLIYRLRGSYFDSFRENISALVASKDKVPKRRTSSYVLDILKSGTEKEIVTILDHLSENLLDVYKPYILNLLDHPSDRVKAAIIKEFYSFRNEKALDKIKTLIETNDDDEVVYEAMEYLLMHSSSSEIEKFDEYYLDHKKDYIKNAALLCLARASRSNKTLEKKYNLKQRIESQIKEFSKYEDVQRKEEIAGLLLTIGYSGNSEYYHFIEKYFSSKEPLLVTYAIKAAGLAKHEPFIDKLISLMCDNKYQEDVIKALQSYGECIVKRLFKKDEDEEIEEDVRGYIPKIIESFESKQSVVMLLRLLKSKDVLVRLNAAKALENIEETNHLIRISDKRLGENLFNECSYFKNTLTAIQAIEKSVVNNDKNVKDDPKKIVKEQSARKAILDQLQVQLDRSLETIFYLLSIKYPNSDMKIAFLGIKNDTEESRINTIEFLENLLQSDLKKALLPLLEYHFLDETETDLKIETIPESKCLLDLLEERGAVTKMRVLNLLQFADHESFEKTIRKLTKHKNSEIASLAKKCLENQSKV
ncbi:MAG: Npt1/Npt2 family nucleotide transporter [Bacteroidota bacterium]